LSVPLWVWALTIAGLLSALTVDLLLVGRTAHEIGMKAAAGWAAVMALSAVGFGIALSAIAGTRYGGQFFAGWITEYSLSVDNLFVFVIIMARFRVPRELQPRALLLGVLIALVLRGAFIAMGSVVVSNFGWMFYVFGGFLIFTAVKLAAGRRGDENASPATGAVKDRENRVVRGARRLWPTTDTYQGTALTIRRGERRVVTPMLLVVLALGTTDVMFALDSIPAVFGLTREPYIIFTANVFALLGLRQMYFLIGGLLDRLVYLSSGLSVILAFIGIKMIFEALHSSGVKRVASISVPLISTPISLAVIGGVLGITVIAGLMFGKAARTVPKG
jgi:tellurite resistance protein TerC